MVAQAAYGVPGIDVNDDGSLTIDDAALDPEAPLVDPGFSNDAYVGLRAFVNAVADRTGPIKVSLTGPVTLGIALHAAGVAPELAFRISTTAVRQRARALVQYVAMRVPQSQVVAFLDEPAMGSAMFPEFPLLPLDAVDLVSGALAALEPLAITGLHCCGTADWRLLMQAGPQILSLPTDGGIESASGALAAFLERGGWVAWGAVPTDRPIGTTVERLWRMLSLLWCTLVTEGGCDPVALRTQAMITPACGMWRHGIPQAQQVLQFTNRLAERLHDQAIGVRLTVGA
jgi:methionine synthase II (cobalamin-independent)